MRRVIARPPLRDLNGNTGSDRDSYGAIFEDHGPRNGHRGRLSKSFSRADSRSHGTSSFLPPLALSFPLARKSDGTILIGHDHLLKLVTCLCAIFPLHIRLGGGGAGSLCASMGRAWGPCQIVRGPFRPGGGRVASRVRSPWPGTAVGEFTSCIERAISAANHRMVSTLSRSSRSPRSASGVGPRTYNQRHRKRHRGDVSSACCRAFTKHACCGKSRPAVWSSGSGRSDMWGERGEPQAHRDGAGRGRRGERLATISK